MKNDYEGKICPYCKTKLKNDDIVVVCDICEIPHHLSCWQENGGCTTFGCSGKIKEVIGEDFIKESSLLDEDAKRPVEQADTPVAEEKTAQPVEQANTILYKADCASIQRDAVILIESVTLSKTGSDELFAECVFRSITERSISAILVDFHCKDVWGNSVPGVTGYQYLDLETEYGSVFGQGKSVLIPDKNTRVVSAMVKKVLYASGEIEVCSDETLDFPALQTLTASFGTQDIADEFARETCSAAQYVPARENGFWRCACGSVNHDAQVECPVCGCASAEQFAILNDPELPSRAQSYLKERQEQQAKEQAELQAEQERQELAQKLEEKKQRRKKRRKLALKISIFSLLGLAAAACLTIFVVLPFLTYQKANSLLDAGQYDESIALFEELGDYRDSEDMIVEANYQKAQHLKANNQYEEAYKIYTSLNGYKDSKDGIQAVLLLWEAEALGYDSTYKADRFSATVKLQSDQYDLFYTTITLFIAAHEDSEFWRDGEATAATKNTATLLRMLPSSYKNTATLLKLFNLLNNKWWLSDIFEENEPLMRQCWSLGFVQDLAERDECINHFLRGNWYGSGYYLKFYDNGDGGTWCSYDLPWVAEPYGTRYYNIDDMIYYFDDANSNHLAKVWRFTILDYDTISVFCYKNGYTYTMYR